MLSAWTRVCVEMTVQTRAAPLLVVMFEPHLSIYAL